MKCLEKKPSDRYATAKDLANDLSLFLLNRPIEAKPLSVKQKISRWAASKPFLFYSWITFAVAYSEHIFSMLILNLPNHQGAVHNALTTGILLLIFGSVLIQKRIDAGVSFKRFYRFTIIVPLFVATIVMSLDQGPSTIQLALYPLMIMAQVFIEARARAVWLATTCTLISYGIITLYSWLNTPEFLVTTQQAVVFVISQVLVGGGMHLLIKRYALDKRE